MCRVSRCMAIDRSREDLLFEGEEEGLHMTDWVGRPRRCGRLVETVC
jgi:hypothetical protein